MRNIDFQDPGKGLSAKGRKRVDQIIAASLEVLINSGYHGFTMRQVASHCGISVGNLNYYYNSKSSLLSDLMDAVVAGYLADFDQILKDHERTHPEQALEAVIRLIYTDLGSRETTVFFPELWAMANHDEDVSKGVHQIYDKVRRVYEVLIPRINPGLSEIQVGQLALFLSASIEGHTMFVGHEKPWAVHRQAIGNIAVKALMDLVRSIQASDIKS